jgi:hypothetical protein
MSKCFKHGGQILSERENMALAGIVSTQLLHHFFVAEFSSQHCQEPERLLAFSS